MGDVPTPHLYELRSEFISLPESRLPLVARVCKPAIVRNERAGFCAATIMFGPIPILLKLIRSASFAILGCL